MRVTPCDNGRRCGVGKVAPCPFPALHWVQNPIAEPWRFCGPCFAVLLAAGRIAYPNLGKKEFDRRERVRVGKPRLAAGGE